MRAKRDKRIHRLQVMVDAETLRAVESYAKKSERSKSDFLNQVIRHYLNIGHQGELFNIK